LKKTSGSIAKDVDEYLKSVPKEMRATLEKLRKTIKSVAPKADEGISWGMPMYKQDGILVGFAAFKDHCSLFPGPAVIEAHKDALKKFSLSKGTIRFTTEEPLPPSLVKKLVKARIAENQAKRKKR
jgi:uncharacterized protein YdhG (YjbR/CyaY superfamily)